jgi:hypothetical protein
MDIYVGPTVITELEKHIQLILFMRDLEKLENVLH